MMPSQAKTIAYRGNLKLCIRLWVKPGALSAAHGRYSLDFPPDVLLPMTEIIKQIIDVHRASDKDLSERSISMAPSGPPLFLTSLERSIQFLREVCSRSSFLLPAYYSFFATNIDGNKLSSIDGYPGAVLQSYVSVSSLNYISLVSRKIFDHSSASNLSGAGFAKASDILLYEHADFWGKNSGRATEDAFNALQVLRDFFKACSKSESNLLKDRSRLCKRIGLLKQYANRSAAHLTLENYHVTWLDVLHVTASTLIVAEIIRLFDRPDLDADYFDRLNKSSFDAIQKLYPETLPLKLFDKIGVKKLADQCLGGDNKYSMDLLLERIPDTLSYYWDIPPNEYA
jgi:hypothetical protein